MKKAEKKNLGAVSGVGSALSSAYQKLPEFPYLDRATTLILIVCVLGYLGFTAYIFFSTPPAEIEARILEGSLEKNSALALLPGEDYLYELGSPGGAMEVSYAVRSSPSCAGVMVTEAAGQESQSVCILKNGMLAGSAGGAANANFGNQSMLLFSPWMLAASENFSWSVNSVYSAHGAEMIITTRFESKGKQQIAGREAYEIDVDDGAGAAPARFFIDSGKRVLLYADLGNVTVKMAKAPFELDWNASEQN